MIDFLTFKKFISIEILIFFYYFGAVFIPILLFLGKKYFEKKFIILKKSSEFMRIVFNSFSIKNRVIFIALAFTTFLFMEIVWRMGFEAIIGYFQVVEALK